MKSEKRKNSRALVFTFQTVFLLLASFFCFPPHRAVRELRFECVEDLSKLSMRIKKSLIFSERILD